MKRLSNEEYMRDTLATTQREVQKLTKSKEYRQMVREKGKDAKNWNWQMRERRSKHEIEEE